MSITSFASKQRLKTREDEDFTLIIPGKFGQIYEYDNDQLAVMFMPKVPHDKPVTGWMHKWTYWRKDCVNAGMELIQNGDWEGTLRFDDSNPHHVRLATRMAGIHRKRVVSEAAAKAGAERLAASRQNRLDASTRAG